MPCGASPTGLLPDSTVGWNSAAPSDPIASAVKNPIAGINGEKQHVGIRAG
jgi:hypothetical protein